MRFVITFTSKLVNCFSIVLLATYFATQQADETLAITIKIMIDFTCRFCDKARKSMSYL